MYVCLAFYFIFSNKIDLSQVTSVLISTRRVHWKCSNAPFGSTLAKFGISNFVEEKNCREDLEKECILAKYTVTAFNYFSWKKKLAFFSLICIFNFAFFLLQKHLNGHSNTFKFNDLYKKRTHFFSHDIYSNL